LIQCEWVWPPWEWLWPPDPEPVELLEPLSVLGAAGVELDDSLDEEPVEVEVELDVEASDDGVDGSVLLVVDVLLPRLSVL